MTEAERLADWLESPQCGLMGDERVQKIAALLRAALPEVDAPAGWRLVPEELTKNMLNSISASINLHNIAGAAKHLKDWQIHNLWIDVLNVAPALPSSNAT